MIAMQFQTISEEWVVVITPLMLKAVTNGTSLMIAESKEFQTNKFQQQSSQVPLTISFIEEEIGTKTTSRMESTTIS